MALHSVVQWISVGVAVGSAAAWLRGATVKVTREQVIEKRKREAAKRGEQPNLAGAVLDGWDMSGTFAAQAKWNAVGAILAGTAVVLQAIAPLLT